jgi:hypothetical protein
VPRLAAVALLLLALTACTRVGSAIRSLGPPTATPTPSWVGQVRAEGTPVDSFLSRIAEVDERSGRPLTARVSLREAPGRGAPPNGVTVGPGERVFLIAVELIGNERFFNARSFDGLRRGWLPEGALAPQDRPPRG